jgi:hypothetical protein
MCDLIREIIVCFSAVIAKLGCKELFCSMWYSQEFSRLVFLMVELTNELHAAEPFFRSHQSLGFSRIS